MKCDELNAHKADVYIPVYGSIADAEVYLKAEADKVIVRYKYKRCLAMAECRDAQARLFHRFGTEVMLNQLYGRNPAVDMKRMDRRSSRCRLASQLWKKRAEEFKEAK